MRTSRRQSTRTRIRGKRRSSRCIPASSVRLNSLTPWQPQKTTADFSMSTSTVINLGSVEKIALGHSRCYVVGGEEIAVFRQRDGRLFATQNRCPHKQGPLAEGISGGGKVIC